MDTHWLQMKHFSLCTRDDICYKCNGWDPPEEVSAENVVHWTACERDCSRWFHAAYINSVPSFICGWCSGGKL